MNLPGIAKLIERFRGAKAVILAYHRVAEPWFDPLLLSVSSRNFLEHLEVIRDNYRPMSLVELGRHLKEKIKLPEKTVVVTFDDGYYDNLKNGLPALAKTGVPATIFATGENCRSGTDFWWDSLVELLFDGPKSPATISLEGDGKRQEWTLTGETDDDNKLGWNVRSEKSTPRQAVFKEIYNFVRWLPPAGRSACLDKLKEQLGQREERQPNAPRPLTIDELRALAASRLVEIGSHTMNHPALKVLAAEEQRRELTDSKIFLEKVIGRPVRTIAYPYGGHDQVDGAIIRLAEATGFEAACANYRGAVRDGADRFNLPRFVVRNWGGEEFKEQLESFFAL